MSNDCDVSCFVKEPGLLIELCRKVIDQIEAGSEDFIYFDYMGDVVDNERFL